MRASIVSTVMLLAACSAHERASEHADEPIAVSPLPTADDALPPAQPPAPAPRHTPPRSDAVHPRFTKVLVGESGWSFGRHRLMQTAEGGVFLTVGAALIRLDRDGSFEYQPQWTRGIELTGKSLEAYESTYNWWSPLALGGTWPEGAYLVLAPMSGGRGGDSPPELYRRGNGRWNRIATASSRFDTHPIAFGPWKDGSLLALQTFMPRFRRWDDEGLPLPADVAAFEHAVAGQKRLVVVRGRPRSPELGRRDVRAFASLPTGEIYAAIAENDAITLVHYDDVSASEQSYSLPDLAGHRLDQIELRASADDRVWLFAGFDRGEDGAYVAHFDGNAWQSIATDCVERATSGSIDDEGAAYFVCTRRPPGSDPTPAALRWRRGKLEELATGVAPLQIVARSADDIWVLSAPFVTDELAVVHTGTPLAEPAALPTSADEARAVWEWADPAPLGRRCETPLLPLVAGSDRAAAQAVIHALERFGVHTEIVDVRVAGRTETAVVVRGSGAEPSRHVRRIAAKLGAAAGEPSCNERPPVTPAG